MPKKTTARFQYLNKPLTLSLSIYLTVFIFNILFNQIFSIFDSQLRNVAGVSAAWFIAYLYSSNFNKKMPRQLKIQAVCLYFLWQLIVSLVWGMFYLTQLNLWAIISAITSLIYSIFIYYLLTVGSNSYFKYTKK